MLVQLDNVKKSYKDFQLDCSLCLEEDRITGLVGPNGAGKTTAFKIILGLAVPDSGAVNVLGNNGYKEKREQMQVGVTLAESGFGNHMTVKQIASVMDAAYENFSKKDFLEECGKCGLEKTKKLKEFSTGMKAKLKLLLAMSHDARLLVLDEPTAGLDAVAREEVLDMLRTYMETEGRGILISSHISSDLENLCDDIYMINQGKVVFHEDTDVILSQYAILKLDEKDYEIMDKNYLLCVKKEPYGYSCLTKERQFYQENYPDVVIQKCGIDDIEKMMAGRNAL